MDEPKTAYAKYKLIQCADIDPIAGEAKAGSKDAYFKCLDNFVKTAPFLQEGLKVPQTDDELKPFLRNIYALQEMLEEIASPSLPGAAKKTADWARRGERKRCGDALFSLSAKVKSLCTELLGARGGGDTVAARKSAPPPMPMPSESFEKLCRLIDALEVEEAKETLRSLKESVRHPEIGEILDATLAALIRYDYDAAAVLGKQLLETAKGETAALREKRKILAIDDMPDILNAIWTFLKDEYSVYCVTNYAGVLKCLSSHSIDLVLLDIEMPEMGGFDLLVAVRAIPGHEKTPIIFLTGNSSAENVRQAVAKGANDFITKPIDPDTLRARIKKHIG